MTDMREALKKKIRSAIAAIPANNPGYISACPTTLSHLLAADLLDKIADCAARAALSTSLCLEGKAMPIKISVEAYKALLETTEPLFYTTPNDSIGHARVWKASWPGDCFEVLTLSELVNLGHTVRSRGISMTEYQEPEQED